jgi:hypothetical protein
LKVLCSVCGREGILEVRGNSQRVVHYEWVNGRRVFARHTIKADGNSGMGTVGTGLGTEKVGMGVFSQNKVDRAGFEPATSALRRRRSYQTDLPALCSRHFSNTLIRTGFRVSDANQFFMNFAQRLRW